MLNKKLIFLSLLSLVAINSLAACPPVNTITITLGGHFTAQWLGLTWIDPNPNYGQKLLGATFSRARGSQNSDNPALIYNMICEYDTKDGEGFLLETPFKQTFWVIGPNWELDDSYYICTSTNMNIFDCPFDRYNK